MLLRKTLDNNEISTKFWTREIGLLIPRSPTCEPIGDASFEGLGGYCIVLAYMWRIHAAEMRSHGFDIPTNDNDLIRRYKAEGGTFDNECLCHINILEFVTIIINLWFAIAFLKKSSTPLAQHIIHAKADNTSSLSWLMFAARTKRAPIRRLARLCQCMLTSAPISLCIQASHIRGIENDDADILSRPVSRAPTWASVTEHGSPELTNCQPYRVPHRLLSVIAKTINSTEIEDSLESEMTKLWTLAPNTLSPGCEHMVDFHNNAPCPPSQKRRLRR